MKASVMKGLLLAALMTVPCVLAYPSESLINCHKDYGASDITIMADKPIDVGPKLTLLLNGEIPVSTFCPGNNYVLAGSDMADGQVAWILGGAHFERQDTDNNVLAAIGCSGKRAWSKGTSAMSVKVAFREQADDEVTFQAVYASTEYRYPQVSRTERLVVHRMCGEESMHKSRTSKRSRPHKQASGPQPAQLREPVAGGGTHNEPREEPRRKLETNASGGENTEIDPCESHNYDRDTCEDTVGCVYEIATDACYAGASVACGEFSINCGTLGFVSGFTPNCYCEYFTGATDFEARDVDGQTGEVVEELTCTMLEDPDDPSDDGCCGVQTCQDDESTELGIFAVTDDTGTVEPETVFRWGQYLIKEAEDAGDTDRTMYGQTFERIVTINSTHRPKEGTIKKVPPTKVKTGKSSKVKDMQVRRLADSGEVECRMKYKVKELAGRPQKDLPETVQAQIKDGFFHGSWRPCKQKLFNPKK